MLLAINYAPYQQDGRESAVKDVRVDVNMEGVIAVEGEKPAICCRENGSVKRIEFSLRPHESVLMTLLERESSEAETV